MTDGPFAETKEQLAGFYLLEAENLDQALALAAKIPPAREGRRRGAAGSAARGLASAPGCLGAGTLDA